MQDKVDYRYLKAFYYTAKFANFSKAAHHLTIAQSAVSRQIKLLEDSIGEQLILRSSKQVLLTVHGEKLLKAIEAFEKNLETLTQTLGLQTIKVGILHGLLETWFLPVIKNFTSKSEHQLHISIHSQEDLKTLLTTGNLDVIFTTENLQGDLITSLKIFEEEQLIISSTEIDPKKLTQYPWVIYGDEDPLYLNFKAKNESHLPRIQRVESITAMVNLVKMGIGIAIVPSHVLKMSDKLKTYPFKEKEKKEVYLGTHNYLSFPPHLKLLISLIKN